MSKVWSDDNNDRFGVLKLNNNTKVERSNLEYSPINLGQSQGSINIDTMIKENEEEHRIEPENKERPWRKNAAPNQPKQDQVSNGSEQ